MSRYLLPSLLSLLAVTLLMSCGEDKTTAPAANGNGNGGGNSAVKTQDGTKENAKVEAAYAKFIEKKDEKSETFLTSTIAEESSKKFTHCCTKDTFAFNIELKLRKDHTYSFKFTPHNDDYEQLEKEGTWKVEATGLSLEKLGKISLASNVATKAEVVYISFTHSLGQYDLTQHPGLILGSETFPIPPVAR